MRVALFDWTAGGHHALYVRRFTEALKGFADVVVAVPDVVAEEIRNGDVEVVRLGGARPALDFSRPLAPQHRELAEMELSLFEGVAQKTRPDHMVHLYADPVIRRLVGRPILGAQVTLCVFFPRGHYLRAFGALLPPKETLRGWFQRYLLARWRRRPDAHAVFLLDEEAAHWMPRAQWLPEPPVATISPPQLGDSRSGFVLYGALARRKGIDLLARAVSLGPIPARILLAGAVEPTFEPDLRRLVEQMKESGTEVELRGRPHREDEGLAVLRSAACALLPYPDHYGMSRVLVEAATVGTPVIVHDRGLLAHLVRKNGLGLAVNCRDPKKLRTAMLAMVEGFKPWLAYRDSLACFASRYSPVAFQDALRKVFVVHSSKTEGAAVAPVAFRVGGG